MSADEIEELAKEAFDQSNLYFSQNEEPRSDGYSYSRHLERSGGLDWDTLSPLTKAHWRHIAKWLLAREAVLASGV